MAQLVDIRKVAIGPKFLTARVVIDEGAPLYTDEDPEGTARVLDQGASVAAAGADGVVVESDGAQMSFDRAAVSKVSTVYHW